DPHVFFTEGRELAVRFNMTCDGEQLGLKVLVPHGYPNACPKVYLEPLTERPPHVWADGALCIYGVMVGWNPGQHTIRHTVKMARLWVAKYIQWKHTGEWQE